MWSATAGRASVVGVLGLRETAGCGRCLRSGVCLQTPALSTWIAARRPMRASAATETLASCGAIAGRAKAPAPGTPRVEPDRPRVSNVERDRRTRVPCRGSRRARRSRRGAPAPHPQERAGLHIDGGWEPPAGDGGHSRGADLRRIRDANAVLVSTRRRADRHRKQWGAKRDERVVAAVVRRPAGAACRRWARLAGGGRGARRARPPSGRGPDSGTGSHSAASSRNGDGGELGRGHRPLSRAGDVRPDDALIAHVQEVGFDGVPRRAVLRADVLVPGPARRCRPAPRPAARPGARPPASATTTRCTRSRSRFFQNALGNDDQLRQRVALALHEILVVSGVKITQPSQMAPYLNMLLDDAFENYRTILHDSDPEPGDGALPRHGEQRRPGRRPRTSRRTRTTPARCMQLFSIGVNLLNPDGSLRARRRREPDPDLYPGQHRGLRPRLHRLDLRTRPRAWSGQSTTRPTSSRRWGSTATRRGRTRTTTRGSRSS